MEFKHHYRRRLPHFQHDNATYFVTSRLHGSLPKSVLDQLAETHELSVRQIHRKASSFEEGQFLLDEENRRHFRRMDKVLHQIETGPHHFRSPAIAQIFFDAALFRHERVYELICFTVMSNHTHMVFTPLQPGTPLHWLMGRLKRYVGQQANAALGLQGAFWQDENWDRIARNAEELSRIIDYVLNNSVEAGLVNAWQQWPYTWLNPDYL